MQPCSQQCTHSHAHSLTSQRHTAGEPAQPQTHLLDSCTSKLVSLLCRAASTSPARCLQQGRAARGRRMCEAAASAAAIAAVSGAGSAREAVPGWQCQGGRAPTSPHPPIPSTLKFTLTRAPAGAAPEGVKLVRGQADALLARQLLAILFIVLPNADILLAFEDADICTPGAAQRHAAPALAASGRRRGGCCSWTRTRGCSRGHRRRCRAAAGTAATAAHGRQLLRDLWLSST
jgi:hypothetical protein